MLDMFGNMQQQQEAMAEKLRALKINAQSENGLIKIAMNGQKEILDLSIDESKWESKDLEEIQDLLVVTLNEAMAEADVEAEKVANAALNDILPGGMAGLGNLFGG